jgi:adenylate kinase family enzyme
MRIAIVGPSGSGKTWLAIELSRRLGSRHVELDALHHEPNWESCGADVLRERVLAATEGRDWIADGTYHSMIGDVVFERADTLLWLDLPVAVVMWQLVRRTYRRIRDRTVLWNGNVEGSWRESARYLMWPAFRRAFENRRTLPKRLARHPHLRVHRLRSDRAVRRLLSSLEPTT